VVVALPEPLAYTHQFDFIVREYTMSETTIGSVAVLIAERPVCAECICRKSGLTRSDLARYLDGICSAVRVEQQTGRCAACGYLTTLFSLVRQLADN
jgi:hypothetical protein